MLHTLHRIFRSSVANTYLVNLRLHRTCIEARERHYPRKQVSEQGRWGKRSTAYEHVKLIYISIGMPYFRGRSGIAFFFSFGSSASEASNRGLHYHLVGSECFRVTRSAVDLVWPCFPSYISRNPHPVRSHSPRFFATPPPFPHGSCLIRLLAVPVPCIVQLVLSAMCVTFSLVNEAKRFTEFDNRSSSRRPGR